MRGIIIGLIITMGLVAEAAADEMPCFDVSRNTTSGPAGAILVNKCTGETWILVATSLVNGTTSRWYPITTANGEVVLPR